MTLQRDVLRSGTVSLVGAGPGDPDLLTRRAVRRLAEADVVLYDALVDPEVLGLAPTARRIFVGKRAGRPAVKQEFINRLLVRAARRGRRVVRLKGGDPFVFGRGGEEAIALVAAGVPFEIVPGVSSAIASPALAGIPVTHRGISTAFVVVSGHSPDAYSPVLGSLDPQTATIVVLMGLGSAADIVGLLQARGWAPETPAAVLYTLGRARLSFAQESDIDEFVDVLTRFERGEIGPTSGAPSASCAARTGSGRPPTRRCCASRSRRAC
jgi:uroporphyrin-III C-methyltransferase / precorrin-2 dehydrogenase / sirohydrochlorin ferrochelatase